MEKTKTTPRKDLIDYFSKQPPEVLRLMLLKLNVKEIDNVCHTNKYFKEKVCTDYFWGLYIDKNLEDVNQAFMWAIRNRHIQLIKVLLTNPKVDPTANNNWAIRKASENGHLKVVKLLLTNPKVDPSAYDNYAIRFASENGHLKVVEFLLTQLKVDPSVENNAAIQMASQNGHLGVVKLLLTLPASRGIDSSADDNFAIREASHNGHFDVVKLLLAQPKVTITVDFSESIKIYKLAYGEKGLQKLKDNVYKQMENQWKK